MAGPAGSVPELELSYCRLIGGPLARSAGRRHVPMYRDVWRRAVKEFRPRSAVSAGRTAALLYVVGAVLVLADNTVIPQPRPTWTWVPWALAPMLGLVALVFWKIPERLPPLWWLAGTGIVPVGLVLLLGLGSGDASAGSQLTFCWPVLFAAYQLRPGAAWAVTAWVCGADVLLCLVLKPFSYIEDATAVPVIFVAITLAVVMARSRLDQAMEALRHEADHDPLTGLATRRRFDADVAAALAQGVPVSLVLVDVDHFKDVNDSYGHAAGDEVLKYVAQCLDDRRHLTDTAYRLGGDEMAVLLLGCPQGAALDRAEDIRKAVAAAAESVPRHPRGRPAPTVSVGVATSSETYAKEVGLLRAADQALYVAKAAGRNRVSSFSGRSRADLALPVRPAQPPVPSL